MSAPRIGWRAVRQNGRTQPTDDLPKKTARFANTR
jgi:hypothetical protein